MQALPRSFYDRDTILVAHDLLGKYLVHTIDGTERIGKIVEVEAYLGPHDLAAHTSKGNTPRTRSEEHTSELQSLMRISYAVFCLKKKKTPKQKQTETQEKNI